MATKKSATADRGKGDAGWVPTAPLLLIGRDCKPELEKKPPKKKVDKKAAKKTAKKTGKKAAKKTR